MSPDWRKVSELVARAIEVPAAEREAFLREVCAGDPGLEREVRSLVAHHRATGSFLEPAGGLREALRVNAGAASAALRAGESLGVWRLLRPIGEGGMGVVWLVERADGQFVQRGALKIIRQGFASEEMVRRFLRERRILASLEHPNIARLVDGGSTADGLPYLVMEYIEGVPLYDYCRERAPSLAQRLELFLALCGAVQYAHRRLVLHRDLKPGNVLVVADGAPRLLDFGVAKMVDDALAPAAGDLRTVTLPLTPEYASPEQLRGEEATTSSDLYSLGVLLYELLTGAHPYPTRRDSPSELMRAVLESEPPRPSTRVTRTPAAAGSESGGLPGIPAGGPESLRRRLDGDLDNIVLRALHKDPARRYATVEQLADDVRRHLAGHPVLARPDSWGYRAGKFVRRNRVPVALGALAALALVAGTIVSTWQAATARRESALATRRLREVQALANTLLFDVYDGIENMPGATAVRAKVVQQAASYLDALTGEGAADSSLRFSVADAYVRLGIAQVQIHGGDPGRSFARARALCEQLLHEYPDNEHAMMDLIQIYTRIGALDEMGGSYPPALEMMNRAADLNQRLVARHPGDRSYRAGLPKRFNNVGNALVYNRRYAEAIGPLGRAMAGFAALAAEDTASAEWRRLLGMSTTVYGQCQLAREGGVDSALAAERRALAIYTDAARRQPENVDLLLRVADAHERLGSTLALWVGEEDSGAVHLDLAAQLVERAAASDPLDQEMARDVTSGRVSLGLGLALRGDESRARSVLEAEAPRLARWWRSDSTNTQMLGARPALMLGLGLLAEARARRMRGPARVSAWREARARLEEARQACRRDSLAGPWDAAGVMSRRVAREGAVCDSMLATLEPRVAAGR